MILRSGIKLHYLYFNVEYFILYLYFRVENAHYK